METPLPIDSKIWVFATTHPHRIDAYGINFYCASALRKKMVAWPQIHEATPQRRITSSYKFRKLADGSVCRLERPHGKSDQGKNVNLFV